MGACGCIDFTEPLHEDNKVMVNIGLHPSSAEIWLDSREWQDRVYQSHVLLLTLLIHEVTVRKDLLHDYSRA